MRRFVETTLPHLVNACKEGIVEAIQDEKEALIMANGMFNLLLLGDTMKLDYVLRKEMMKRDTTRYIDCMWVYILFT
jgi:hypothetical protein